MNTKDNIREFINSNLIIFDDDAFFSDDDNIFEMGFVNSLFAMKLLNYVEEKYSITVEDDEMELANFSTVNKIFGLVQRKTNIVTQ